LCVCLFTDRGLVAVPPVPMGLDDGMEWAPPAVRHDLPLRQRSGLTVVGGKAVTIVRAGGPNLMCFIALDLGDLRARFHG
jgi:hypothetical protein